MVTLIVIEVTSSYIAYRSYLKKDNLLDEVKLKNDYNNDIGMFAIMLEQEDGTYIESNDSHLPTDGYNYNDTMSGCMDKNGVQIENALIFDVGRNMVTVNTNKTVYCYLYFDKRNGDVYVSVSTDGEEGVAPRTSGYAKTTSCTNGTSEWNNKYNRLEIGNLSGNQVVCSLDYIKDTTTYTNLKSEVQSAEGILNANGYRYTGKQPDNWVWFNNEKWRIIGSIPVCLDSSCNSKDNLVKIIRSEMIGAIAYDSANSNTTWGTNTLYELLNSYYYGKGDATGNSPCLGYNSSLPLCNYENIGISNDATDYYGSMIKNVYWYAGTTKRSNSITTSYGSETSTISKAGRIGIMNASDYGYASGQTTISFVSLLSHEQNNWMYSQGVEWTLSPTSSSQVLQVYDDGSLYTYDAKNEYGVRPVVYLDSSVYIISGDGTEKNPYRIGM